MEIENKRSEMKMKTPLGHQRRQMLATKKKILKPINLSSYYEEQNGHEKRGLKDGWKDTLQVHLNG